MLAVCRVGRDGEADASAVIHSCGRCCIGIAAVCGRIKGHRVVVDRPSQVVSRAVFDFRRIAEALGHNQRIGRRRSTHCNRSAFRNGFCVVGCAEPRAARVTDSCRIRRDKGLAVGLQNRCVGACFAIHEFGFKRKHIAVPGEDRIVVGGGADLYPPGVLAEVGGRAGESLQVGRRNIGTDGSGVACLITIAPQLAALSV